GHVRICQIVRTLQARPVDLTESASELITLKKRRPLPGARVHIEGQLALETPAWRDTDMFARLHLEQAHLGCRIRLEALIAVEMVGGDIGQHRDIAIEAEGQVDL